MPKSWIDRNSDTAEGRDTFAADGAQYQAPRFTVPQDDEDIFHGVDGQFASPRPCAPCFLSSMEPQNVAGPMPCTYSRPGMDVLEARAYATPLSIFSCRATEIPVSPALAGSEDRDMGRFDGPFPFGCRAPETEIGTDMDMTLLGDGYPPPCGFPCRMSEEANLSLFPLGCSFSRIGAEIETAADMDMTLLGESFPPPCIMPCRMSAPETELAAMPPCGACRMSGDGEIGLDMNAQADAIPYPCLPGRMPEVLQGSAAAQLPPPAYYCRQSR